MHAMHAPLLSLCYRWKQVIQSNQRHHVFSSASSHSTSSPYIGAVAKMDSGSEIDSFSSLGNTSAENKKHDSRGRPKRMLKKLLSHVMSKTTKSNQTNTASCIYEEIHVGLPSQSGQSLEACFPPAYANSVSSVQPYNVHSQEQQELIYNTSQHSKSSGGSNSGLSGISNQELGVVPEMPRYSTTTTESFDSSHEAPIIRRLYSNSSSRSHRSFDGCIISLNPKLKLLNKRSKSLDLTTIDTSSGLQTEMPRVGESLVVGSPILAQNLDKETASRNTSGGLDLVHNFSMSADNIPILCLNDCPSINKPRKEVTLQHTTPVEYNNSVLSYSEIEQLAHCLVDHETDSAFGGSISCSSASSRNFSCRSEFSEGYYSSNDIEPSALSSTELSGNASSSSSSFSQHSRAVQNKQKHFRTKSYLPSHSHPGYGIPRNFRPALISSYAAATAPTVLKLNGDLFSNSQSPQTQRVPNHYRESNQMDYPISKDTIKIVMQHLMHDDNCHNPNCPCHRIKITYKAMSTHARPDLNIQHRQSVRLDLTSIDENSESPPMSPTVGGRSFVQTPLVKSICKLKDVRYEKRKSSSLTLTPPQCALYSLDDGHHNSLSPDNLPKLCLNDCPITVTDAKDEVAQCTMKPVSIPESSSITMSSCDQQGDDIACSKTINNSKKLKINDHTMLGMSSFSSILPLYETITIINGDGSKSQITKC